ncbi:MarR family transcriptional regulator [Chitinophaga sp. 212800008-4]|uniref:MarR family winged helix-turn-helix transcriptional regulator n=1 Tax=unclassified Chitinophaga TaxID=2619133 RepID=UPI0030D6019D
MKSEQTVFYYIERAIKSYRQFVQRNITEKGFETTIDQGLILSIIQNNPGITQQQIAIAAFKDHASVTRIIENLVSKQILKREFHAEDRRRFHLTITPYGLKMLQQMKPVVNAYRKKALQGITAQEIELVKNILHRISENCQ